MLNLGDVLPGLIYSVRKEVHASPLRFSVVPAIDK